MTWLDVEWRAMKETETGALALAELSRCLERHADLRLGLYRLHRIVISTGSGQATIVQRCSAMVVSIDPADLHCNGCTP